MSARLSDYDYHLPAELIARRPLARPRRFTDDGSASRIANHRASKIQRAAQLAFTRRPHGFE